MDEGGGTGTLCDMDWGDETGTPAEEDAAVVGGTTGLPLALTELEPAGIDEAPGEELPAEDPALEVIPGALLAGDDEGMPMVDEDAPTEDEATLEAEDAGDMLLPAAIDDEVGDGYGEIVMLIVPEDAGGEMLDDHEAEDPVLDMAELEAWLAEGDIERLMEVPLLLGIDVDAPGVLDQELLQLLEPLVDMPGILLAMLPLELMVDMPAILLLELLVDMPLDEPQLLLAVLDQMLLSVLDPGVETWNVLLHVPEVLPLEIAGTLDDQVELELEVARLEVLVVDTTAAGTELEVLVILDDELGPAGLYEPPLRIAAKTSLAVPPNVREVDCQNVSTCARDEIAMHIP